ncbi:TonB-dependent receptor [Phenylobacterium sp. VNQ135]|uniref:TonB-dependent receptor n=1 Tax=Phenylobacterium sp. VNQ135 TaxID=3400922 RepID=UPI003C09D3F9
MRRKQSARIGQLLAATALTGLSALVGATPSAAQQAPAELDELIVTATRRAQDVTEIPYNITAVSAQSIERAGVASIEDLSRQVPNLVVTSSGNQFLGAQRQIMRGLNASANNRNGVALEQNPVSTYLGNAPYANYFQVEDIERVEVLRGPQGTLYGSGALGGTIRLIPQAPKLGAFEGRIKASAADVAHSEEYDYGLSGVVNIPVGETLAVRLSASHDREAGFINQYGIFARDGDGPLSDPILANPGSPLTSPASMYDKKDVNSSRATNVRAAVRWEPVEAFDLTLAHNYSRIKGFGPSYDTPEYDGGPDPLAPSISYPDTGEYELVSRSLHPFDRTSNMTTLDASYDMGFATLSSTSSYFETEGDVFVDGTWGNLALPASVLPYYTGTPVNPRYNSVYRFGDETTSKTQEFRLVSNGEGSFDYTVGLYYQKEKNPSAWVGYAPGQSAYNQLPGVTFPGFGPGGADEVLFDVSGVNHFTEKAIFGELTWRPIDRLELSGGVRVFKQKLRRDVSNLVPLYGLVENSTNKASFSDAKFRFNATYEYMPGHRAYATFSQGFRRGGANAFALTGFLREPESLLRYQPDSVDNYELGVKGRFANGWRYTADVFFAEWKDPQIGGFTAVLFWPAVFNGEKAESKGFEFELSGDITDELSFQGGYAYTKATLTEDFCVASGDGSGAPNGDIPCAISGAKGTPLPSAPRHSGTFSLDYERELNNENSIVASINANYKGKTRMNLPTVGARYPTIPSYWLVNAYAGWNRGPVTASLFARNLFDARAESAINTRITPYAPIDLYETVGRPRTVGVELAYRW